MVYYLFVIFIVIAAFLMIGIVLIQESKGGGLASNFSSSNSIMGVLSVICAYVAPVAVGEQSVMEKAATESPATNPTNTQGFGASQQPAAGQKATPAQQSAPAAPAQPAK